MDDSDLFLDDPLVTQVRAGAKFQPKGKRKAKDETSGSIPSKPPNVTKDEAATLASAGIDAVQVVQPDNVVDDSRSSQLINPSQAAVTDSLLAVVAVSNRCDDTNSSFERSVEGKGKIVNILALFSECRLIFGLECLDPLLNQSSTNDGDIQIDFKRNETEFQEAGTFPDVETQDILLDMTIDAGRRVGKFKPKPRIPTSLVTSQPALVESVMHPPNSEFLPSETMFGEGSIPDFPTNDITDCSPMDLGAFIPPDPSTSECPMNEEQTNLPEASNPSVGLSGNVPVMTGKVSYNIGQRKASPVSNPSRKSKVSSTGDEVNGNGKATKHLRKQVTSQIADASEDGTCNDDGLAAELPSSSAIDEDKDDNDNENDENEYNVETASLKRRTSRKSKKPVNESEKPPQKRNVANEAKRPKKANGASDHPAKEQPKKFPHSTRRKRRFVDESLLHTPEDEIDFAKVALKDVILLADYKERLAKKEVKTSKLPLTNQSAQKTFDVENAHVEESSIASEQDQGFTDDRVSDGPQSSSFCLNYQSYMNKEPRARWSKQDAELFYGAIRQFGPDFSLIQQLFPGRSRHQIKLKFKNEERRSPFKLSEALASRTDDHSYFEKVIEQLQQVSGADQGSHGDVSIDLTCEEEELTPANSLAGEAAKPEKDEDVAVGDEEADINEDHSTLKSDQTDDDHEILSSYKSAF